MADDLVKRLLHAPADGLGTENLCLEAAERIEALTAERDRVQQVLKEVAQTLAWQSFGECRGFSDNLLSPLEAYNLAKAELKG